ncbi:MAG: DNA primase [Ruminococcaceae bacterium]|nr:DNA primase [Oscillospiraceae bacterium]
MSNILSALQAIDVAAVSYQEWINVGMALKAEGFECQVWENWSRGDRRYHPGECERKWDTFHGSISPITGATIVQMAKDRGWTALGPGAAMDWNDIIYFDGDSFNQYTAPEQWNPTQELITYLETLYEKDDFVGYVTNDVWQDTEMRWVPAKGVYSRTAGELIASLKKHPDDLGATIGDWKPGVGAWIRFNPVDGEGVRNDNVVRFKYCLVESDSMSIADQDALYRKLELPIACLVHSGGKSLHAIVKVDAEDYTEYRKRVEFLYDFLARNGVDVDRQNRNPSRLSRMPGVTRGEKKQYLVATNIGRKSWVDWLDFAEGVTDELPDMVSLDTYKDNLPVLPDELIKGVLRCGHKMLISGPSKAGKSFALMELSIAIAEGSKWLGFPCKKGRVLYVNLEIDPASCIMRFMKIYDAQKLPKRNMGNIVIWNLRGHAVPLDKLVPKLIRRVRDQHFDAIIVDPIYKVITGDENNASDMAMFCNQFDKICTETGCATIYCHHHSKGSQGNKKAMDRASGSGVFARDPDAQLDMIELALTDDIKNNVRDGFATAWRMESNLREFPNIKPVEFWFEYPIHRVANAAELSALPPQGTWEAGQLQNSHKKTAEDANEEFRQAYQVLNMDGAVTVQDMMEYLNLGDKAVYARIRKMKDEFYLEKGHVYKVQDSPK